MSAINQLSGIGQLNAGALMGSLIPVYVPNNGQPYKLAISQLLEVFKSQFVSPNLAMQIVTPTTGFNIALPTPTTAQYWLLIQPMSTLATGAITLPIASQTLDGTEILITNTQQITVLSFGLNGAAAIYGEPATLAAEDFMRLRFVQSLNSWYRIG